MANPEHVEILKQGVKVWNNWVDKHPNESPDLSDIFLRNANLSFVDLSGADLSNADLIGTYLDNSDLRYANLSYAILSGTDFYDANLSGANLTQSDLSDADLGDANLTFANLINADLSDADLSGANLNFAKLNNTNLNGANLTKAELGSANLSNTNLSNANLTGADLQRAILDQAMLNGTNLSHTNLRGAKLTNANIMHARIIGTYLENTDISGSRIFGISAWDIRTQGLKQSNLIITKEGEPEITVDNLEIAQFVYLLLNNSNLRGVIDTLTTKSVLILGRFTDERKVILDAIRNELRKYNYLPILFDFEKPTNRDLTETVMTLASLARFVIADLSDPNSIPHELMSFADKLLSVPVQGIFCPTTAHPNPYPMYEHLRRLPHVLPIYRYETADKLIATLAANVISPAEEKVKEVRPASSFLL